MRQMNMGINWSNKKGVAIHPPQNLRSLLEDIESSEDAATSLWVNKFREHLRNLGRFDLDATLDFLIISRLVDDSRPIPKRSGRSSRAATKDRRDERRHLLKEIGYNFFSEDATSPIPLSNQVLREELVSVLSDLDRKDESVLEEALSLVRMAATDYKVWKGGLDSAYNKFVSLKPTAAHLTAVLLSIL